MHTSWKIDYEKRWQEGMYSWQGEFPDRMIKDELEEQFWKEHLQKKGSFKPDSYAAEIFQHVKPHIKKSDTVLEIGPGWGNYTFHLAENASAVTCVDSSIHILNYLKEINEEKQFSMNFIHEKWENSHFEKSHDVVFGYNCFYRMKEIREALQNINRTAKRLAIIGMTTGPIQPHYEILQQEYGYAIKTPRRDYLDLLHLLYDLNIYANCELIPLMKEHFYDTVDEIISAQSKKILSPNVNRHDVEKTMEPFIEYQNGKYIYRYPYHAVLIAWQPK